MAAKYSKDDRARAKNLLRTACLPRDALPYTPEFQRLRQMFMKAQDKTIDKHRFWCLLCRAGKEGGARCKAKAPPAPVLTQDEAFEVMRLCPEGLGARDRLPYTSEFEEMHKRFCDHTGRELSRNQFWRVLSHLAKRSRKPTPIDIAVEKGGMPKTLEQHITRMNPWWQGEHGKKQPPKRRGIYQIIVRHLRKHRMPGVAVRGPRQVGKTTLQQQIIQDFLRAGTAKPAQILRVQFDELPSIGKLAEPILAIVQWYENKVLKQSLNESARRRRPAYLFFDEIQNIPAWDSQIKALVDQSECNVFVTGSSALRIQSGHDNLAGRLTSLDLGALHLSEIGAIRGHPFLDPYQPELDLSAWIDKEFWEGLSGYTADRPLLLETTFGEFSEWGGYPYCHNTDGLSWPDAARYLTEVAVQRTIDHDLRVGSMPRRDRNVLKEIFRLALRYAGKAPRLSTLADELWNILEIRVQPQDVRSYLEFLESSMLIRMIEPLQLRGKRQACPGKICICDHAVRAAWLQEKISLVDTGDEDLAGHIMDSIVGYYLSCFEGLGLAHFPKRSTEPEVDYVLTLGANRIPLEVKYRNRALNPKCLKGLKHFISKKKYNAPFGVMITKDEAATKGEIVAIPAKRFLLLG